MAESKRKHSSPGLQTGAVLAGKIISEAIRKKRNVRRSDSEFALSDLALSDVEICAESLTSGSAGRCSRVQSDCEGLVYRRYTST